MSILGRVHTSFFNYHQFNEMTNMHGETVLARIMTALDLEFKRALHYHDEGYESDNDYGLRCLLVFSFFSVYSVSTMEASFNLLTTREHNVPSFPSHPGDPGMSCLSVKESADAQPLMIHPCQKWTPMMRNISLQLTLMTQYGPRSLYPIAQHTYAFIKYSDQQPHPTQSNQVEIPQEPRTNGYSDPRGPTRPHLCP